MAGKEEKFHPLKLEVKVPAHFRCPISLDVMRSPVSLCTGVTYDRSSIQRWLDSGKKTCPATNQPLPSTDLVPNLTLRRLINHWSAPAVPDSSYKHLIPNMLRDLRCSSDPSPLLRNLASLLINVDDFDKNAIAAGGCAAEVISILIRNADRIDTLEASAKVLSLILAADSIEGGNKKVVTSLLISDLNASVSGLLSVLKEGNTPGSGADATRVLSAILLSSDSDFKASIAGRSELIHELIRLIGREKNDGAAIDAALECLVAICGVRKARLRMVKERIVPAVVMVLTAEVAVAAASTAEKAIRLLEAVSGIAEGRSEICEAAEECLGAVLRRMMKAGRGGMEAAVAVLWSVCHRFQDRRAVEAVAAANGGATKILLLMQSDCSPAARQMSGDLLKIFRVNTKSCLAGYDTKTTHIMPF